jgi:hypothetical protein
MSTISPTPTLLNLHHFSDSNVAMFHHFADSTISPTPPFLLHDFILEMESEKWWTFSNVGVGEVVEHNHDCGCSKIGEL